MPGPRVIKKNILYSAELIKSELLKFTFFLALKLAEDTFILLNNVIMPTTVAMNFIHS